MSKKPLVSVVSCFFNRGDVAKRSIESLLEQTYGNIEFILINDCSQDDTLNIINSFKDQRIQILSWENKGFTRSLIEGISKSKGELIAIHGSGDISLPRRIEAQVDCFLENHDVGVVGCHIRYFDLLKQEWIPIQRAIDEDQMSQLIRQNPFVHGEVMFRRTCYEQVGGYREFFEFAQDRDLWLRMATVTRFFIVPEFLYQTEPVEGAVSKVFEKSRKQAYLSEFAIACAISRNQDNFDLLEKKGPKAFVEFDWKKSNIPNRLKALAIRYLSNNQYDAAKQLMVEAFCILPSTKNMLLLIYIWLVKKYFAAKNLI